MAACCLTVSVGFGGSAHAACIAADVVATPDIGAPNEAVILKGSAYASECRDTGQTEPAPPSAGIELVFEQAGRSQILGVVDAGAEYTFTASVSIPATATPGAAVLVAQSSEHQPVRVPFTVLHKELPLTGPHTGSLAAIGLALVLAGALATHAGTSRPAIQRRLRG